MDLFCNDGNDLLGGWDGFDWITKAFGVLARLGKGIDFDAIDGAPVDIVFLLLLPTCSQGEQLTALACVTRQLRDQKIAAAIRAARSTPEIYEAVSTG